MNYIVGLSYRIYSKFTPWCVLRGVRTDGWRDALRKLQVICQKEDQIHFDNKFNSRLQITVLLHKPDTTAG
jgi:hypothetical protein